MKVDELFINESKKCKRKFAQSSGNPNIKELMRDRNFKPTFYVEVVIIKKSLLNIKKVLSYQNLKFTFRYEQLLRKTKDNIRIKGLGLAAAVHNLLP